jgi:hypothetical protein
VLQSWSLFKAMTRYPTLDRVQHLVMPTLVIAGDRDPLVRLDRAHVFAGLPHVDAVKVHGAHALNFSKPELIASLIEAHLAGRPLGTAVDPAMDIELVAVGPPPDGELAIRERVRTAPAPWPAGTPPQ